MHGHFLGGHRRKKGMMGKVRVGLQIYDKKMRVFCRLFSLVICPLSHCGFFQKSYLGESLAIACTPPNPKASICHLEVFPEFLITVTTCPVTTSTWVSPRLVELSVSEMKLSCSSSCSVCVAEWKQHQAFPELKPCGACQDSCLLPCLVGSVHLPVLLT